MVRASSSTNLHAHTCKRVTEKLSPVTRYMRDQTPQIGLRSQLVTRLPLATCERSNEKVQTLQPGARMGARSIMSLLGMTKSMSTMEPTRLCTMDSMPGMTVTSTMVLTSTARFKGMFCAADARG